MIETTEKMKLIRSKYDIFVLKLQLSDYENYFLVF